MHFSQQSPNTGIYQEESYCLQRACGLAGESKQFHYNTVRMSTTVSRGYYLYTTNKKVTKLNLKVRRLCEGENL